MHPTHDKEVMLMLKNVENENGCNADCLQDASYSCSCWEIRKRVRPPSRPTDMSELLGLHLHLEKERKNSRHLPFSSHMDSLNMYHWVKENQTEKKKELGILEFKKQINFFWRNINKQRE